MVLATLLFLIPGVESCQGKALKAKPQLTFFVSLHVGHRWPGFLSPSPSSAENHSSMYANITKISLPFPTLRMETSLHWLYYKYFILNYPPNSSLAAYFHIWSTDRYKTKPNNTISYQVSHQYICCMQALTFLQEEQLGYFFAWRLPITDCKFQ